GLQPTPIGRGARIQEGEGTWGGAAGDSRLVAIPMSMVACPGCGQLVPANKSDCMACGRPLWRKPPAPYVPGSIDRMAEHASAVQFGYVLLAASFIFGPVFIIAAVFGYVKRDSVRGTWLESHCTWLVDTALVAVAISLAAIAGFVASFMVFFPIGFVVLLVLG